VVQRHRGVFRGAERVSATEPYPSLEGAYHLPRPKPETEVNYLISYLKQSCALAYLICGSVSLHTQGMATSGLARKVGPRTTTSKTLTSYQLVRMTAG
jgi:hypothetical protein